MIVCCRLYITHNSILKFLLSLVGVSRITKEEASKLVNQTYRLPGDEDHYVVHLDVFHQLHCLVGRCFICSLTPVF